MRPRHPRVVACITAGILGALATGSTPASAAPSGAATSRTGPSSSASPYIVGTAPGVRTTSILTVGDSAGGYRLAGLPDGLGAYDNGNGTFTLLANHELGNTLGAVHAHGAAGAFVSRWTIRKSTLQVLTGRDLIQRVHAWDPAAKGWTRVTTAFGRFCSGDLPATTAFYDRRTRLGTTNRIFMNGEETGADGRAVAHVATGPDAGSSYIWPGAGRASWENQTAMPEAGATTVVAGTDDSAGGQVYFYVGRKRAKGNDVEKAGLVGGRLFGLKIDGLDVESDATTDGGRGLRFHLVEIPGADAMTGAQLEAASTALGVSRLARPEDSAWDPQRRGEFYFATTASFTGISRLWKLRFDNPVNVLAGGVARIAVSGAAYDAALDSAQQRGPRMMDNITAGEHAVLAQEDPGGQAYLAGIFRYDRSRHTMTRIAQHDPARFVVGAAQFLTIDEESSGIIPAPFLGENAYLLAQQAHYPTNDPVTVEGGQLLVMNLP